MRALKIFFDIATVVLRWLCLTLIMGLAALVTAKVFFRYVLNSPLVWSDEIIMLILLALTYLGAALAANHRAHINVEIMETLLMKWGKTPLKVYHLLQDLFIVVTLSAISLYGIQISFFSRDQETDILLLSYFWVYILLPAGLLFMIIMILKRIFEDWFFTSPETASTSANAKGA
jgi:TRAP-type C4-dicarboxylate transport system permease small subunit